MPDSFFATQKPRKRKRDASSGPGGSKPTLNGHRGPKAPRANGSHSGPSNGRPNTNGAGPSRARGGKPRSGPPKQRRDEELSGSDDEGGDGAGGGDLDSLRASTPSVASASEDETETPAQKRLRLAQLYLRQVEAEEREKAELGGWDAEELDKEIIGERLRRDVAEDAGKVCIFVGERIDMKRIRKHTTRRAHAPLTAALAAEDGSALYTAEKDGSITAFSLHSGSALKTVHKVRHPKAGTGRSGKDKGKGRGGAEGHTDEIWALAISPDGRTLASGGKDKRIGVWDLSPSPNGQPYQSCGTETGHDPIKWRTSFSGHRDSITGLSFLKQPKVPPTLYASSADRTLRAYATTPGAAGFVEALFGHQDIAVDVDVLRGETPVSVGARDKTVRYWKIRDETQLVFRGGGGGSKMRRLLEGGALDALEDEEADEMEREKRKREEGRRDVEGSLECVAMLDERTFLTGGDSGSISLWSTAKKKPVYTHAYAHGLAETQSSTEGIVLSPRPVLALGALRYGDIFASGSWDGSVRLWRVEAGLRRFIPLGAIDAPGVVNSLQIIRPPRTANVGRSWSSGITTASSKLPNSAHHDRDVPMDSEEDGEEEEEVVEDKHAEPSLVLVAALGREPRMGRWIVLKEGVQNRAMVCVLPVKAANRVSGAASVV